MDSQSNTWSGRGVLHVDMDAFFAAVEQLDHPEWRGQPVIIGSPSERGVVSTASYEARVFGVHSAMPSARAALLCPHAIWAAPNFARYREMSERIFDIFRRFTPLVQPLSIDEAFLDVTPTTARPESPAVVARSIRSAIDETGITCSIGVATSKTVAKIASDFDKPHGITVVPPGEETGFLAPLPIEVMSGIGRKTAERLHELGIRTLGDLSGLDDTTALSVLGSGGPTLVLRSKGLDSRPVQDSDPRRSISAERTFSEDLRSRTSVNAEVTKLTERVGRRLRRSGRAGRTVTVKLRFSDFTTRTAQRTLAVPTDDDRAIEACARDLVNGIWSPGVGVRLLGVGVSGFDAPAAQLGLLDDSPALETAERHRKLIGQIDALKDRFGDDSLGFGTAGLRRSVDPDED